MPRCAKCLKWLGLLLLIGASGCAKPPDAPPNDEGARVRARFEELQKVLKAQDAEALWAMLSSQTQDDAQRAARTIRADYDKADAKARAQQEKDLGLPGAELAKLTDQGVLKTRRLQKTFREARGGKFDSASVHGDNATVYFFDPEGDREKLVLIHEKGRWQLWLKMPGQSSASPTNAEP